MEFFPEIFAYGNNPKIRINENKLIGFGFELTFENYIEKVIVNEGYFFVLVSICDKIKNGVHVRGDINDNIYCVDKEGKIVWQVKVSPPPPENYNAVRAFVDLKLTNDSNRKDEKALGDNVLIGYTFFGNRFIINQKTGETTGQLESDRF